MDYQRGTTHFRAFLVFIPMPNFEYLNRCVCVPIHKILHSFNYYHFITMDLLQDLVRMIATSSARWPSEESRAQGRIQPEVEGVAARLMPFRPLFP